MFKKSKIVLLFVLFLGLFLRLYGNNWDQGWHLHPDERFLTMVGVDVKIPSSLAQYLDQRSSSFNPVNKGHAFYVYGTFPILLNKVAAQYFLNDTYDLFNLQGRVLSGVADFFIIIIIYRSLGLIEKKLKLLPSIKYLGAFFYAIAVLPIQLSHFFTVDTFLDFFCWLSLYFAVKLVMERKERAVLNISLSGLFLGLALACKVSAVYFAPLIGLFLFVSVIQILRKKNGKKQKNKILAIGMHAVLFSFFAYLALRFGSPYYFETNSIFNPQLSKVFLNNIQTLQSFDNPAVWFPPANQWIHAPWYLSPLNLIVFGVGIFYFLFALYGSVILFLKRNILVKMCLGFSLFFFVFQSLQYAKTMRYLLFLYPLFAICAAVGLSSVFQITKKFHTLFRYVVYAICYLSILIWPLAFMSIYTRDHSRVAASKWIYEHIPPNSKITYEYWDDPLPLMVQDPTTRNYRGIEIHIFDPDTKEKWRTINNQLAEADYYIMSSNRGWGSIPKTPERYPITTQFYKNMFAGKENYTLIKDFSSYPSLRYLGIPVDFPDQWAEEAFTVYDHPFISIFKNND